MAVLIFYYAGPSGPGLQIVTDWLLYILDRDKQRPTRQSTTHLAHGFGLEVLPKLLLGKYSIQWEVSVVVISVWLLYLIVWPTRRYQSLLAAAIVGIFESSPRIVTYLLINSHIVTHLSQDGYCALNLNKPIEKFQKGSRWGGLIFWPHLN